MCSIKNHCLMILVMWTLEVFSTLIRYARYDGLFRGLFLPRQNFYRFQVCLPFVLHQTIEPPVVIRIGGIQVVQKRVDHEPHRPFADRRLNVYLGVLRTVQFYTFKYLKLQLLAVNKLFLPSLLEIRALGVELERRVVEYDVAYVPETPEVQHALNDLREATLILPRPPVAVLDDIQQESAHLEELPRLIEYDHPGAAPVRQIEVLGYVV